MQFENCKYNHIELAARFITLAEKFKDYIATHKTKVDFCATGATKEPCGTVACHGGFGALILGVEIDSGAGFSNGARAISKFLGFDDDYDLVEWARENPEYWGNRWGGNMFGGWGYEAFGKENQSQCTLTNIASWYLDVAGRLLAIE